MPPRQSVKLKGHHRLCDHLAVTFNNEISAEVWTLEPLLNAGLKCGSGQGLTFGFLGQREIIGHNH